MVCFAPACARPPAEAPAHAGVGFLNGVFAGLSGLSGVLVTIWCQLRGWPRDQQRAVFQPAAVATFLMTGAWAGGAGVIGADTVQLFLIGLPARAVRRHMARLEAVWPAQ